MGTIEQLTSIFRMVFDDVELFITPKTNANDVEGWDSLSHANLVVAVECHFNVRFSNRELLTLKNVGDLIRCIENKLP